MPINQFVDDAAYEAHTPSTTESEVSLIQSTNDVKYNGVNVEVTVPRFGDVLYLENTGDANNLTKHFIDGDSLNASLLPNSYIPVGGVVENDHGKVLIHYYKGYNEGDNAEKWASAWLYDITATVDGTERSIVFRQPKDSGYLTVGTFTHSCSTQEEFATALDTWLRANQGGTAAGGTWNYNWHCEYMENYAGVMKPIVIIDNMVDYRQYADNAIVASGATASANMANSIPAYDSSVGYPRKNGGSGWRTGISYRRFLEYFQNNSTIATLTSQVSIKNNNDVVSRAQFNDNQYCSDLRDAYGTYEKYIESLMLSYPSRRRINGYEYGNAKKWTAALANREHKKLDGTVIKTFPIQSWCTNKSFNCDGLRAGDWWLAGGIDYYKIMKNITYGLSGVTIAKSDRLNRALNKMGGSPISCSQYRWSCVRYGWRYAWCFNHVGYVIYNDFLYAFRVSSLAYVAP